MQKNHKFLICQFIILSTIFGMLFASSTAFADNIQQSLTDGNSLNVKFHTIPDVPTTGDETKFKIDFLNPDSDEIQPHIDYQISIETQGNQIFSIPLTHTSKGSVTIPYKFDENGSYQINVQAEGILFVPIPEEIASFTIDVGQTQTGSSKTEQAESTTNEIPSWIKNNAAWWADDQIDDNTFIQGIQFLIKSGIITI